MKSPRVAAAFFVALCLVLCGMVLHRQIAAHPLPPQTDKKEFLMKTQDWQPAKDSISREARATVTGQLDAFHAGDGVKAMSYQTRRMRIFFRDPVLFEQMIVRGYPEVGHYRSAKFGPIWSDHAGEITSTTVMVEGENGNRAIGFYQLVREDGKLRISDVHIQRIPSKRD